MQVYLNRRVHQGPWGGGNLFVKAFHQLVSRFPNVENLINTDGRINPEVMLLAGLENDGKDISVEQAIMYKMYVKPECQLVLRVNENDARKGTRHMDDALLKISEHIDGTVFVSHWLQDYFMEKGWACKNNTVIKNGVDMEIFRNNTPKLNNGKVNIVAHHWSDNRMKGADIYEEIDRLVGAQPDKFAFTYIGRHQCDFKHTKVIRPIAGEELGRELGQHDVYVSASRFDPGPNHVLEALSCALPTLVHIDGGGCVEFAGKGHAYRDWAELERWLTHWPMDRIWSNEYTIAADQPVRAWHGCVQEYIEFLEATWQNRSASHNS